MDSAVAVADHQQWLGGTCMRSYEQAASAHGPFVHTNIMYLCICDTLQFVSESLVAYKEWCCVEWLVKPLGTKRWQFVPTDHDPSDVNVGTRNLQANSQHYQLRNDNSTGPNCHQD